jgi:flagellar assembly protein FliH
MSPDPTFAKLTFPSIGAAEPSEDLDRARIRGHAAGYAAGLRVAAAEAEILEVAALAAQEKRDAASRAAVLSALAALRTATEQVGAIRREVLGEADSALAAAAIELAEAIIGRELDDTENSAKTAVRRAISIIAVDDVLGVRLHPEDLAVISADDTGVQGLHLISDPSLDRGDAVLDVPDGIVDARISTALARARAVLVGGQQ